MLQSATKAARSTVDLPPLNSTSVYLLTMPQWTPLGIASAGPAASSPAGAEGEVCPPQAYPHLACFDISIHALPHFRN